MIFASSRAEYELLKKELISTLDKLGFDQVFKHNLKAAKEKQLLFDAAFKGDK
jgi:multiple sugar transport system substrate-binding protein/putative aldouronate transport system substrate-binding protein